MALTGDKLTALETSWDTQNTTGTTTSTGYTATLTGGTACGFAFIAPASGKVIIHNNCQLDNVGGVVLSAVRVRTGGVVGSGTDFVGASDDHSVFTSANIISRYGASLVVSGLTPGSTYNVQQLFRVTAGTGSFSKKHLILAPQP